MYRRYEPAQNNSRPAQSVECLQSSAPRGAEQKSQQNRCSQNANSSKSNHQNGQGAKKSCTPQKQNPSLNAKQEETRKKPHPITKLIPQSVYNPENGKILGLLSAEDLLIIALIIVLLDGGSEESPEDNSTLIYALLYILLYEHIKLPF